MASAAFLSQWPASGAEDPPSSKPGQPATPPATSSPVNLQREVKQAFQSEAYDKVIELSTQHPAEFQNDGPLHRYLAASYQGRGVERFFAGDPEKAIADFDKFVEMIPDQDAHHWQRGIAYYYAGQYEKGRDQFTRHREVNPEDVENAVWHLLCAVRIEGVTLEDARRDFIPVTDDTRVPMAEIHALFAGTGSPAAVLSAARRASENSTHPEGPLLYAHLYLGLYYEALGKKKKSAEHIRLAASDYFVPHHYMGRVAKVHAQLRGIPLGDTEEDSQPR